MAKRKVLTEETLEDFDEIMFGKDLQVHIERMSGKCIWIGVSDAEGTVADITLLSDKKIHLRMESTR